LVSKPLVHAFRECVVPASALAQENGCSSEGAAATQNFLRDL